MFFEDQFTILILRSVKNLNCKDALNAKNLRSFTKRKNYHILTISISIASFQEFCNRGLHGRKFVRHSQQMLVDKKKQVSNVKDFVYVPVCQLP